MYIDDLNRKAKIGIVTVDANDNRSIRIRYTYPKGQRNVFYTGKITAANWNKAIQIATVINEDINSGCHDDTLSKYKSSKSQAQKIKVLENIPNLLDIWNNYSSVNKDRVAPTTIKSHWRLYEKHYLSETPTKLLEINQANEFVAHLLTRYTPGSLAPRFSNCLNPSVNLAVKTRKIKYNPYKEIYLQKRTKRHIEAYESEEVKAIVAAFYSDEYVKKGSIYPHSFYAPMIDFLSIVGCRPSECHALT